MSTAPADTTGNTAAAKPLPPGLRPWKPGQSGNPAGRPPMPPEIRDALRDIHGPAAVTTIANFVTTKRKIADAVRLRAAEIIVERAYGKAPAAPGESLADLAEALVLRFRRPDDEDQPRDVTATASEVP